MSFYFKGKHYSSYFANILNLIWKTSYVTHSLLGEWRRNSLLFENSSWNVFLPWDAEVPISCQVHALSAKGFTELLLHLESSTPGYGIAGQ